MDVGGFILLPFIGTTLFDFGQFAIAFGFVSLVGDFAILLVLGLVVSPYVLFALLTAATVFALNFLSADRYEQ
eukprot:545881-Amphidinium_carterae.2